MTPCCVVIPTFWARRRGRYTDRLLNVYSHPTPIDEDGTLPECLRSLETVRGLERVCVIVAAADSAIEHEAEDRVRGILRQFPGIDSIVFGPAELGSLHRRLEQLEFSDIIPGVSLVGYGAVRNVGLIVAGTLSCQSVVFVDDDEIIEDPGFLERAAEGLGTKAPDGTPVMAKTGYYVDGQGSPLLPESTHWSDRFWRANADFNRTIEPMLSPPRLRPSSLAFGGCLALHRDMYTNVSFDPWIVRGEDIDYLINARMHGGDVFLDNEWQVVHRPPAPLSEAIVLRQEVYRFIYEHRKLEFAKSQVDLRQVSPASLRPFPGDLVGSGVTWRAFMTAALHAVAAKERAAYLAVARAALSEAARYARRNCDNYFAFQRRWPMLMDQLWDDVALGSLFSGERRVDRTAITGRFPVIPAD